MTSNFFSQIITIEMYQISQGKNFLEKLGISPNCGCFQKILALFDTFTNHSGIKFKFFGYFYPYKHFI